MCRSPVRGVGRRQHMDDTCLDTRIKHLAGNGGAGHGQSRIRVAPPGQFLGIRIPISIAIRGKQGVEYRHRPGVAPEPNTRRIGIEAKRDGESSARHPAATRK